MTSPQLVLLVLHGIIMGFLGLVLLHTLVNQVTLPRLRRFAPRHRGPRVSVLIPARNEAARIGACVRSWAKQDHAPYEIVVYDDDSSDDTSARAARAAPGVRVLRGHGVPRGWRGKPHAAHRLGLAAHGEVLIFADADVVASPPALGRVLTALHVLQADVVSAVPVHDSPRAATRALLALQNWAALAFVPSWLGGHRIWRGLAALNGQFMAISRRAYDQAGGFAAVRGTLAEDTALGRHLVGRGVRVRLVDGGGVLTCRDPYATLGALWAANARNLLPIFFGSAWVLLTSMALLLVMYVAPLVILTVGLVRREAGALWINLPLIEITAGLLSRALADRRAGYAWWVTLTHPLGVVALGGMAVTSVVRFRWRRMVEWRGRRYPVRDEAA